MFRENFDYRLDSKKKIVYVPRRLKNDAYTPDTGAYKLFAQFASNGYYIRHDTPEQFIKAGQSEEEPKKIIF